MYFYAEEKKTIEAYDCRGKKKEREKGNGECAHSDRITED